MLIIIIIMMMIIIIIIIMMIIINNNNNYNNNSNNNKPSSNINENHPSIHSINWMSVTSFKNKSRALLYLSRPCSCDTETGHINISIMKNLQHLGDHSRAVRVPKCEYVLTFRLVKKAKREEWQIESEGVTSGKRVE